MSAGVASHHRRIDLGAVWSLIKDTANDWNTHDASRLAAALACYTLLSIAPLVVLSVALAGWVFGERAARGEVATAIGSVVGPSAATAIQAIVVNARPAESGSGGTVVGLAILLFGASGVFHELQVALNTIWSVDPEPGRGLIGFIRHRVLSFAMVVAVAFLLLVSLLVSAALEAAGKFFAHALPGGATLWLVVNFVLSLAIDAMLFALVFKVVPDAYIRWRDVVLGAIVTSLLFALGKWLLGLYIGRSSVASSFGAAGSLAALVIWVYYSSQIVFLGAEFTQVYSRRFGTRDATTRDATSSPPA